MICATVIVQGEGELGSFWLASLPRAGELVSLRPEDPKGFWRVFAVHHRAVPLTSPGTSGAMPGCVLTLEPANRMHVALVFVDHDNGQRSRIVADAGLPLSHAFAALPLTMRRHRRAALLDRTADGEPLELERTPAELGLEQEHEIRIVSMAERIELVFRDAVHFNDHRRTTPMHRPLRLVLDQLPPALAGGGPMELPHARALEYRHEGRRLDLERTPAELELPQGAVIMVAPVERIELVFRDAIRFNHHHRRTTAMHHPLRLVLGQLPPALRHMALEYRYEGRRLELDRTPAELELPQGAVIMVAPPVGAGG